MPTETAKRFPRRLGVYMAGMGIPQYVAIVEALVRLRPEIEVVEFVVGDLKFYRWARARAGTDPRIRFRYQHDGFDPFEAPTPDPARLAQLEARYGVPNLRRYIDAQRLIWRLSEPRQVAYLAAYLEYFEALIREARLDGFIVPAPDSLPFMAANTVARRNGCVTVTVAVGRFASRFFPVHNELEQIAGLDEAYAAVKARDLTTDERRIAAEIRASYVVRKVRPTYLGVVRHRLRALPSPLRGLHYLRRRRAEEERYFDFTLLEYAKRGIAIRLRQPLQRRIVARVASTTLPEKFFYMPLNYEPECFIDVQRGFYRSQVDGVGRVVAALPAGYELVVKEHPNMLPGARPLRFYRDLVRLGSVRLLPQHTDSYPVVERCAGVITIAGTTGVEALFHGKPVLLFGHAVYEAFRDGVTQVTGFADIAPALSRMADAPPFDPALLDKFVIAVLERSYPGAYDLTMPDAMEPANLERIASGIATEMDRTVAA